MTRLRTGRSKVQIPAGAKVVSSPYHSDCLWRSPILFIGDWDSFLGVKPPARDVEHPSSSNAEVKNQ